MRFKSGIKIMILLMAVILTGCYKSDLEDFKNVSEIEYKPQVAVPLVFKYITLEDTIPTIPFFTTVTMSDTATIELPTSKDSVESVIKEIKFKVLLENTFPFSGVVQVYFTDQNGAYKDSLLTGSDRIMSPGNPVTKKEIIISVDKERYIDLTKNSKNMLLYYKLTTSDINGINDSYLLINIGAIVDVSVDLKK